MEWYRTRSSKGLSRVKAIASSSTRANQATDAARAIEGHSISNGKTSISPVGGCNRIECRRWRYRIFGERKGLWQRRAARYRLLQQQARYRSHMRCAGTVWRCALLREWVYQNGARNFRSSRRDTRVSLCICAGVTRLNIGGCVRRTERGLRGTCLVTR